MERKFVAPFASLTLTVEKFKNDRKLEMYHLLSWPYLFVTFPYLFFIVVTQTNGERWRYVTTRMNLERMTEVQTAKGQRADRQRVTKVRQPLMTNKRPAIRGCR